MQGPYYSPTENVAWRDPVIIFQRVGKSSQGTFSDKENLLKNFQINGAGCERQSSSKLVFWIIYVEIGEET